MVALTYALRTFGIPGLDLLDVLFRQSLKLQVYEDNDPLIRIIKTGKNPTMRYLERTHRIAVAWLHELFNSDELFIQYIESKRQHAVIFTKVSLTPKRGNTPGARPV